MIGVIMIGGHSRRMGREKHLLTTENISWLERRLLSLGECGLDVFISGREGQKLPPSLLDNFIRDHAEISGKGVFSAMISSLEYLRDDVLFLPVDMDNISTHELKILVQAFKEKKLTCFKRKDGQIYQFPCVIPFDQLENLRLLESKGLPFIKLHEMNANELVCLEVQDENNFRNFNYPSDI